MNKFLLHLLCSSVLFFTLSDTIAQSLPRVNVNLQLQKEKPSQKMAGARTTGVTCGTPNVLLNQHQANGLAYLMDCALAGEGHGKSKMYQVYKLENDLEVQNVLAAVYSSFAASGSQKVNVNIYLHQGAAFPAGTLTKRGGSIIDLVNINTPSYVNFPVTASMKAGEEMVVEFDLLDGQAQQNDLYFMANQSGQLQDSYAKIESCGYIDIVPLSNNTIDKIGLMWYVDGCEPEYNITSGAALHFDGVNDYGTAYHSFYQKGDFTAMFWLKVPSTPQPDSSTIYNAIMDFTLSGGYKPFFILYKNQKSFPTGQLTFCSNSSSAAGCLTSSKTLNDNKWHHITYAKTDSVKVYIDGILNLIAPVNFGGFDGFGVLTVGAEDSSTVKKKNFFRGAIDQFKLYDSALTQAEIQAKMYQKDAKDADLAYDFDEGLPNRQNINITSVFPVVDYDTLHLTNFDKITSFSNFVPGVDKIYVDDDATGANNGSSWADAFKELKQALPKTTVGNEVWVAAGTYKPALTFRDSSFVIKDSLKVYGGFKGGESVFYDKNKRNLEKNESILSGNIGMLNSNTDNSFHVVLTQNVSKETMLNGFTITKGYANGAGFEKYGGGWLNVGHSSGNRSNPKIYQVIFKENYASSSGGGLDNEGNAGGEASPEILDCKFYNNTSPHGGGIFNYGLNGNCSPYIGRTIFTENVASNDGGAINWEAGDGLANSLIENCIFHANGNEHIRLTRSALNMTPSFSHCTFYGANIRTISVFQDYDQFVHFTNSIFWNNGGFISDQNSLISVQNSITEEASLAGTNGNVNADPQFVDAAKGLFQLKCNSPARDIGLVTSLTTDFTGVSRTNPPDAGAFEYGYVLFDEQITPAQNYQITGVPYTIGASKILNTNQITYRGSKFVELRPGFEVAPITGQASVFKAEIGGGCL